MWRKRQLFFLATGMLVVSMFVRVGYKRLGWGGYFYVDIAAPWDR